MKTGRFGRLVLVSLLAGLCLLLAACGRNTSEETVSAGQQDKISGFLFIFDNRSVQQQLVRDMEEDRLPRKVTCELYKVERDYGNEEKDILMEDATVSSEDPAFIRSVYNAMTDMIVVGQIGRQENMHRCMITFDLADGSPCIFHFESVSIIQIEGQNYVVESSGRLWDLLPVFSEEA